MSPRQTYLELALLIARDGLPAPMTQAIREHTLRLEFAAMGDAARWAEHFQLRTDEPFRHDSRVLHEWTGGNLGSRRLVVECWVKDVSPGHVALAAKVTAAILSPDDPVLPAEVLA